MRVSMKSWHYRLVKYVLRSNVPTPKTMQNGCPYFWLLLFSISVVSFIILWKIFVFFILLIPKFLKFCLKNLVINWIKNMDDRHAYDIFLGYGHAKLPITAKLFFKEDNNEFFEYFLLEKYNISGKISPEEYKNKKDELNKKWGEWREQIAKSRQFFAEEAQKREEENERRRIERERIQAERKARWDARMKPINNGFKKIFTSIRNAFTFNLDWKSIIKGTKQFFGAVITIFLLAVSYFVVNGLVYCIIAATDWCIINWIIFAFVGCVAIAVGIIYVLYVVIGSWLQAVVNKYQIGKRVWYIEPLIYLIWYPVKYIAIVIAYGFFYIICIPIKFIFYNFLFKLILAPLGIVVWKLLKAFGKGLVNSTGVFGEYFNASYSDYCPGIEWVGYATLY